MRFNFSVIIFIIHRKKEVLWKSIRNAIQPSSLWGGHAGVHMWLAAELTMPRTHRVSRLALLTPAFKQRLENNLSAETSIRFEAVQYATANKLISYRPCKMSCCLLDPSAKQRFA